MPAGTGGLPLAHKQVGESVSANAVTNPSNPKLKAADIDRKMKFYGVIEAFRQGNYPSNAQIDHTLNWLNKEGSPIDEAKLSREGRGLVEDVRRIVETARQLVKQKNADELAQNFLWHTRHVDTNAVGGIKAPMSQGEAKEHGDQAVEHIRTLGKLIFTNAEFRKLLKDVSFLGRDILADGAAKAADKARPADHQINQIDETAGDARWVGKDGQERGAHEPVPDTGLAEKRDQARNMRDQAQEKKDQVKGAARDTAQSARGAGENQPGDNSRGPSDQQAGAVGNTLKQKAQQHVPDEYQNQAKEQAEEAKQNVARAIHNARGPTSYDDVISGRLGDVQDIANGDNNLSNEEREAAKEETKRTAKNKALSLVPEQHRERVQNQVDSTKNYLREKIPEERRDRFIYRLKKVIVEQQQHRDYQEAIDYFLNLAETYHSHAKHVKGQAKDNHGAIQSDNATQVAQKELRALLERFANNQSMQPMIDAVDDLYTDAQNDDELRHWFQRLDKYVRRVLQEPGYIMKDSCNDEGARLRDDGKGFFTERYRPHREAFFNAVQRFFTAFADDPLNKRFGDEWKQLTKDLLFDGDGNLKYKSHLWQDVRSVILPTLFKNVGYVPIPRIEYTDNMIDMVIENLTLESQNLLPNIFEVEARNYFKLSAYNAIADKSRHSIWISFSQIQADIRDVAFYFKKKSGFPKLSDHGIADVFIGGNGITGKVWLESSDSKHSVFNVKEVKVKIHTLKFKIRDSKHQILYATLRPLASNLIKNAIAKGAEVGIRAALNNLDTQLVEMRDRVEATKDDPEVSRVDAAKQVLAEKKEKAAEKAPSGTFKIVTTRDDKINKWSSPDSIVEKQGARQEHAQRGQQWRSPAFDIV